MRWLFNSGFLFLVNLVKSKRKQHKESDPMYECMDVNAVQMVEIL